ncbi:ATP-binding protein [Acinetobacter defluvii]|uniref:cytochrome b562 n=1 Tax=Acinetobacter defluvii TaxID=1871111 RepID=UPI0014901834|nr:cytochrome b562 [Acinetobacter defluvii]NNP73126.1 ATP-binding protein [Acinetobacter defluvii]
MIKKTLAAFMLVSVCSFSTVSFASGALEGHMETLAKNFKTFNKTTNQNDAIKALDNMRAAAVEAQKIKLKGQQDAKAPTSTQLYDQLIAEIDKTKKIVQDGHLNHAKIEAKKIAAIRDQGHKLYR